MPDEEYAQFTQEAEAQAWTHQNGAAHHDETTLPTDLEDLPLTHTEYLEELLARVDRHYDDEPPQYHEIFRHKARQRLYRIREEEPECYWGRFAPWVRARSPILFWPDVERQICDSGKAIPPAALRTAAPLCPSLPPACVFPLALTDHVAPWLEAYCAYSTKWAPRAAPGFHHAVGLWVLSTIAARRICVAFGSPLYPALFLGLVAESSQYTKSTAAAIGQAVIRQAGCQALLAPDRATPQAMLRSMSGKVPADYHQRNAEEQQHVQRRLAFAGQRGWYYDEWGGMLQQMNRQESPMASFHELLRVLDDGKPAFSSETIQRGLECVEAPYLALLTSSTPFDLAPFMQPTSKWWRDGFLPRFAFIVPEQAPSLTRRPQGMAVPPGALIAPLQTWHTSLGIPAVTMTEIRDNKQRGTGEWRKECAPLPCQTLHVPEDTLDAYYAYNEALLCMDVAVELRPTYNRFHDKAMRIAMLLASFQGKRSVTLPHWAYAQQIVEQWRSMVHQMITTMAQSEPVSREARLEDRIEQLVGLEGVVTMRYVQRRLHVDSTTLRRVLANMKAVGRIEISEDDKGRSQVFLPIDRQDTADESLIEDGENDMFS